MQGLTVLPVRFGTAANGVSPVDDVRRLLDRRRQEFERLLSEMGGKVELGIAQSVKAVRDGLDRAVQDIVASITPPMEFEETRVEH